MLALVRSGTGPAELRELAGIWSYFCELIWMQTCDSHPMDKSIPIDSLMSLLRDCDIEDRRPPRTQKSLFIQVGLSNTTRGASHVPIFGPTVARWLPTEKLCHFFIGSKKVGMPWLFLLQWQTLSGYLDGPYHHPDAIISGSTGTVQVVYLALKDWASQRSQSFNAVHSAWHSTPPVL
jgi:hypothetical protein